jgi:hypothetical protein
MEEPTMRIVRFADAIDVPWNGDFPDSDMSASEEFLKWFLKPIS